MTKEKSINQETQDRYVLRHRITGSYLCFGNVGMYQDKDISKAELLTLKEAKIFSSSMLRIIPYQKAIELC